MANIAKSGPSPTPGKARTGNPRAPRNPRAKKSRQIGRSADGGGHVEALEDAMMVAVDEIGSIVNVLCFVPDLEEMAQLISDSQRVRHESPTKVLPRDHPLGGIALDRVAMLTWEHYGLDIDHPPDPPWKEEQSAGETAADERIAANLDDAPGLIELVVCACAWRLKRLSKALDLITKQAQ